jgi:hypothetical protein
MEIDSKKARVKTYLATLFHAKRIFYTQLVFIYWIFVKHMHYWPSWENPYINELILTIYNCSCNNGVPLQLVVRLVLCKGHFVMETWVPIITPYTFASHNPNQFFWILTWPFSNLLCLATCNEIFKLKYLELKDLHNPKLLILLW